MYYKLNDKITIATKLKFFYYFNILTLYFFQYIISGVNSEPDLANTLVFIFLKDAISFKMSAVIL